MPLTSSSPHPAAALPTAAVRTALAFLLPLILYVSTAAPTIYNLDSAELTTAAYTGGLAHPTGYPLYLLLGEWWSHALPFGDVGYRMNLLSAVAGALAVALADRVLIRLGVAGWAAFGALGLLATSRFFWAMSLVAEVYTLHTALFAGWLLALLRWRESPSPGRLGAAALLAGLGLANHLSTALLLPGAALLLASGGRERRQRALASFAAAASGLVAGLSPYLALPWRFLQRPAFNVNGEYDAAGTFVPLDLGRVEGLLDLVTARGFRPFMWTYGPVELLHQLGIFGAELWRGAFGIAVLPGLLGIAWLWRRERAIALASIVMFTLNTVFVAAYGAVDKETMFLASYVIWAIWVGAGFQALLEWVHGATASGGESGRLIDRPLRCLPAVAALLALLWNYPFVDRSTDRSAQLRGELILRQVPAGGLVVGGWATVPLVSYFQLVEGKRPDLETVNRFLISDRNLLRLLRARVARQAVFVDRAPSGPTPGLRFENAAPLLRVRAALVVDAAPAD